MRSRNSAVCVPGPGCYVAPRTTHQAQAQPAGGRHLRRTFAALRLGPFAGASHLCIADRVHGRRTDRLPDRLDRHTRGTIHPAGEHHRKYDLTARARRTLPTPTATARPFAYRNGQLWCDNVSLESLAEQHGTPLYVYSARQIRERLRLFQDAFSGRPATVCFAVKSNSALAILRLLAEAGAGFDIVSGGELERVRRASKAALGRVVFSGAGKQLWEIDAALQAGILLFNVESEGELDLLAERAEAARVRA